VSHPYTVPSCPICGRGLKRGETIEPCPPLPQHRCPERVLRGIDGTGSVEDREPAAPTFAQRLAAAERLLRKGECPG
jgi:hypothetical protein